MEPKIYTEGFIWKRKKTEESVPDVSGSHLKYPDYVLLFPENLKKNIGTLEISFY